MIPTTEQMDKLLTAEDIAKQHFAHMQCRKCTKWTLLDMRVNKKVCGNCGENEFDPTSATSQRSFNPLNKRKVKGL